MTALIVTPDPATASVLLEVTGAPAPGPAVYSGDAEASVDGWAAFGVGSTVGRFGVGALSGASSWYLGLSGGSLAGCGAQRTLTGLTVGQLYRASMDVRVNSDAPHVAVAVTGIGQGESSTDRGRVQRLTYTFTATATSHVLRLVTLAASPVTATVDFDAVTVAPASSSATTITRSDANGVNPVRLLEGQEPIAGSMTVTDYEAALTGLVRYDLVDGIGATATASTTLDGTAVPWLGVPVLPQYNIPLQVVRSYSAGHDSTSTFHEVVNGPRLATIGDLRARTGRLRIGATDHAAAQAIVDVYRRGEVVLWRQPTHARLDLYHVAQRITVTPDESGSRFRWWVDIDYSEEPAPTAPLLGALGWTFEDVTATYPTMAALPAAFDTFADLVVGP